MTGIRKYFLTTGALLLVIALMVAAAYAIDLPVPANMDFITIYTADTAWVRGIDIYDHEAQVDMLAEEDEKDPASVNLPYYVYPPWYVFATLFLIWFPIDVAARLWFFINLGIISGGVWLLTMNWRALDRALAQVFALTFLPVVGLLTVGQYTAPVFLGICLLVYTIRKEIIWMAVAGLLLLTFKPHVGVLVFLIVVSWMLLSRKDFARRILLPSLVAGLLLIAGSFVLDPTWLGDYASTLNLFRHTPSEVQCDICISLPMTLVNLIAGRPYTSAATVVGGTFLLAAWAWFIWKRDRLPGEPWFQLGLASVITVLVIPNVRNYDYILLLVPLLYLWQLGGSNRDRVLYRSVLLVGFISPWAALLIAGKLAVGLALLSSGLLILLVVWARATPGLESPRVASLRDGSGGSRL